MESIRLHLIDLIHSTHLLYSLWSISSNKNPFDHLTRLSRMESIRLHLIDSIHSTHFLYSLSAQATRHHLTRLSRMGSIRLHLTVSDTIDRQIYLYFTNSACPMLWRENNVVCVLKMIAAYTTGSCCFLLVSCFDWQTSPNAQVWAYFLKKICNEYKYTTFFICCMHELWEKCFLLANNRHFSPNFNQW